MILYHGTNQEFDAIDFSKCHRGKDFGCGFYLSENRHQAVEIAENRVKFQGGKVVVQEYAFDESLLGGLLLFRKFDSYTKDWAEFIYANRKNLNTENIHFYDVVYGPVANDRVGLQVRNLIEHNINIEVFLERLKFMKGITSQYFFGTNLAVNQLHRL